MTCLLLLVTIVYLLIFISRFMLVWKTFYKTWKTALVFSRTGTVGGRSLGCFFGFYLTEVFQSQTNTEKILCNKSC